MTALASPQSGLNSAGATLSLCRHCRTPTADHGEYCCLGCAGAHALIERLGLDDYYLRRAQTVTAPASAESGDDPTELVQRNGERCELEMALDGLHCAACVWLIENALARDPAILRARVNATQKRLHLVWRGAPGHAAELAATVRRLGYRLAPWSAANAARLSDDGTREILRALAVAGFATANVMMISVAVWAGAGGTPDAMGAATRDLLHWISAVIALPALLYSLRPFARSALGALRAGHGSMDLPIVVGVTLAAGASLIETARSGPHAYFESALMLVFFLLIGRYVERRARGRARSAAAHLASLTSGLATIENDDGTLRQAAPAQLVAGQRLHLATGERCLADGMLCDDRAEIDNSAVSGESLPLTVLRGATIAAGAINLGPPVRIEICRVGRETMLARLADILAAAEQGRSRFVGLADRFARFYTPAVHLLAALTAGYWYFAADSELQRALTIAVAVLIVTCPCALALAAPVVATVVVNRLAGLGVLVVSPSALERLAGIDTVVFDKTGTLTLGRPALLADSDRDREAEHQAATLAAVSRHPLARALHRAVPDARPAIGVIEHPGEGLRLGEIRLGSRRFCGIAAGAGPADGESEIWLTQPARPPVRFAFSDRLRPDAGHCIAALRQRGIEVLLLSGDRAASVAQTAADLGIESWQAALSPQDKLEQIRRLQAAGRVVLMVGDGINDAAALAAANVSMSPGDATDLATAAADLLFRGERLQPVLQALDLAQGAERTLRSNLALAALYNLLAVPIAASGALTPPIAALAMSASSLLVIANALRLERRHRTGADGSRP